MQAGALAIVEWRVGWRTRPCPVRLVALAVSRFDAGARRLQTIVRSPAALRDHEAWLTTHVANWLVYVADTCPRVEVGDDLRAQLSSRAQHWMAAVPIRALVAVILCALSTGVFRHA